MVATWNMGMGSPLLETFGTAKGAAMKVFQIVNSEPKIHKSKNSGLTLSTFRSRIIFEDVCFSYPSRPDVEVSCTKAMVEFLL